MGLVLGRKPDHETLNLFFLVKWLVGDERYLVCVRRLRLGSFRTRWVSPLCSATSGCSCVRSSMRVLNLWLLIALEWLHDCCHLVLSCALRRAGLQHYAAAKRMVMAAWMLHGACVVEEAGARNLELIFLCKVVAAGDERYLVCAAVAAGVVLDVMGSSSVFCNQWLLCVRSSMGVLNLWLQIELEWLHDCCHLVLPCALRCAGFATLCCETQKRIVMAASRLLAAAAACVIHRNTIVLCSWFSWIVIIGVAASRLRKWFASRFSQFWR